MTKSKQTSLRKQGLSRRTLLIGTLLALPLVAGGIWATQQPKPEIIVYKGPDCPCCDRWITQVRDYGFNVHVVNVPDTREVKRRHNVPMELASCHTAVVGGYVIEGHVPMDLIEKVLAERPAIRGLAAPGMPLGSPGMEGSNPETYDIVAFDAEGEVTVYATRQGRTTAP